jgi:hypothetical protein
MATQATLQLILELREKVSADLARVAGKLDDLTSRSKSTKQSLDKAFSITEIARFRKEQDALAISNVKVANASGDHQRALGLIKGELALAEAGTRRYNALLLEQIRTTKQLEAATRGGTPAAGGGSMDLGGLVAGLGAATVAAGAFHGAMQGAAEGYKLLADIDQSQRALGTLMGSVNEGNKTMAEAIRFGEKYGFTQREMSAAAAQAATIFNTTTESTEKTLEVLGRLAAINPAEGLEGATVAFKELASGDITSIAERFNIARGAANRMKDEIAAGADPVKVLDKALADMGATTDVLNNRLKGPNAGLVKMELAVEKAKLAAGNFLVTIGVPEALTNFANGLALIAEKAMLLITPIDKARTAVATMAIQGEKSYAEYAAEADKANKANTAFGENLTRFGANFGQFGGPLMALGGHLSSTAEQTDKLSEAQYTLAQSYIKSGVDAEVATTKVQSFVGRLQLLTAATEKGNPQLEQLGRRLSGLSSTGVTKATAELKKAQEALGDLAEKGPDSLRKLADLQRDFNSDMASMGSEHQASMHSIHSDAAKDLAKLYEDTGQKIADIQKDAADKRLDIEQDFTAKLADIDQAALDKGNSLIVDHNTKVRQIEADYLLDREMLHRDHQDKLASLTNEGGERRLQLIQDNQATLDGILANSVEQQASLLESHQEKLVGLAEQAAEQRERLDKDHNRTLADLQEQLAAETDAEQRAAIQRKIDKEQRGYADELAELDVATAKRLAKEEADYAKREAKRVAETEKRLSQQRAAFEREQQEQQAALDKAIAAENAASARKQEDQNAALRRRIDAEVAGLDRELAEIEVGRGKQREAEQRGHAERLADLATNLAKQEQEARDSYGRAYNDRITALNDQKAAEDAAYAARRDQRATQYAEARAEEQRHLGELLQMQVNAQAALGRISDEDAKKLNDALAEKYGIEKDQAAEHWKQMTAIATGDIEKMKAAILSIPPVTDIDINVRMRIEELASGLAGAIAGGLPLGPGRASGGDVNVGTIYPVNERSSGRGVELFAPRVAGQVIPLDSTGSSSSASAMSAAGGDVYTITVDARGSTLTTQEIETAVTKAMNKAAANGENRSKERGY